MMNLKNYTSSVPPAKSVAQIEQALVSVGAQHIAKTYNGGNLAGITFQIAYQDKPLVFKLPANADKVEEMFLEQIKRPHRNTVSKVKEQAQRTAWKLLLDWVEVQVSMITIGRREIVEVFLPYVYDLQKEETLFDKISAGKFKLLGAGQ